MHITSLGACQRGKLPSTKPVIGGEITRPLRGSTVLTILAPGGVIPRITLGGPSGFVRSVQVSGHGFWPRLREGTSAAPVPVGGYTCTTAATVNPLSVVTEHARAVSTCTGAAGSLTTTSRDRLNAAQGQVAGAAQTFTAIKQTMNGLTIILLTPVSAGTNAATFDDVYIQTASLDTTVTQLQLDIQSFWMTPWRNE